MGIAFDESKLSEVLKKMNVDVCSSRLEVLHKKKKKKNHQSLFVNKI